LVFVFVSSLSGFLRVHTWSSGVTATIVLRSDSPQLIRGTIVAGHPEVFPSPVRARGARPRHFRPPPDSLQIPQHRATESRSARVVERPPNRDLTRVSTMTHSRTMVSTRTISLGRPAPGSPPPRVFLGRSSVIPTYRSKRTGSQRLIRHGRVTDRILRDRQGIRPRAVADVMGTDRRASPNAVPIAEDSGKTSTFRVPNGCEARWPGEHLMAPDAWICRLLLHQTGSHVARETGVDTDRKNFFRV
jgi:hypothetical protein